MKIQTLTILIIIILVVANVYQWRNPQVIEVPGEQTPIDSTAWVQRSVFADRGVLLHSIRVENIKLANEIRKTQDDIANLTNINGRLNLQVDSMYNRQLIHYSIPNVSAMVENYGLGAGEALRSTFSDTSYNFISVFGNGLFRVDSEVRFEPGYLENNLDLTQLRDIEISVVTTMNDDRSRLLTYVTSKDFEELEYQTYTELKPRKRWPWFLIGVGVGVTGLAILN